MAADSSLEHIRNFCIIAHIDHGKSTLADRLLEKCGAVPQHEMVEQMLDQMDLERERGITIKASPVRLEQDAGDGAPYTLNLIDTPGHVDFWYEVSHSLWACEGAVLVVDASQGVEAQTIANMELAGQHELDIVPVLNKIDLANVDIDQALAEIEDAFDIPHEEVLRVSAKLGEGIDDLIQAIIDRVRPPSGDPDAPLRALIFDSSFDRHRGAVPYVRVVHGRVALGDEIQMMSSGETFQVSEVGVFTPKMARRPCLSAGDVGYFIAAIKNVRDTRIGDTITGAERPAEEPLAGYREPKPMVFCGLYPLETSGYPELRDALEKHALNDAAMQFEPESSVALGFGFRAGFLGLLHMEIAQERLEREYDRDLIATAPNVVYRVLTTDGEVLQVANPAACPDPGVIEATEEPYVLATIITPPDYLGACMELCQARRGIYKDYEYRTQRRVALKYELPLAEILMDFFDQLKSRSRGHASLDYDFIGYKDSDLVKIDVLLNGDPVDPLAFISHKDFAQQRARALVDRLKKVLPRQLFEIRVQAAIGTRIIASSRIPALRKQVTAKCYGGDVTRKRKLLERQKEGKKRMKQIGTVEVPQEAFLSLLKIGTD